MQTYKLQVQRVYKVIKTLEIEIYASDSQDAIDQQYEVKGPDPDAPEWNTVWDLQNEEIVEV